MGYGVWDVKGFDGWRWDSWRASGGWGLASSRGRIWLIYGNTTRRTGRRYRGRRWDLTVSVLYLINSVALSQCQHLLDDWGICSRRWRMDRASPSLSSNSIPWSSSFLRSRRHWRRKVRVSSGLIMAAWVHRLRWTRTMTRRMKRWRRRGRRISRRRATRNDGQGVVMRHTAWGWTGADLAHIVSEAWTNVHRGLCALVSGFLMHDTSQLESWNMLDLLCRGASSTSSWCDIGEAGDSITTMTVHEIQVRSEARVPRNGSESCDPNIEFWLRCKA